MPPYDKGIETMPQFSKPPRISTLYNVTFPLFPLRMQEIFLSLESDLLFYLTLVNRLGPHF